MHFYVLTMTNSKRKFKKILFTIASKKNEMIMKKFNQGKELVHKKVQKVIERNYRRHK